MVYISRYPHLLQNRTIAGSPVFRWRISLLPPSSAPIIMCGNCTKLWFFITDSGWLIHTASPLSFNGIPDSINYSLHSYENWLKHLHLLYKVNWKLLYPETDFCLELYKILPGSFGSFSAGSLCRHKGLNVFLLINAVFVLAHCTDALSNGAYAQLSTHLCIHCTRFSERRDGGILLMDVLQWR